MVRDKHLAVGPSLLRRTLLVVALGASSTLPAAARQTTTVIRGGSLFDGTGTTVVANPGIVVRAGKIMSVGGAPDLEGSESRVIELADDEVLLPGLFDLHAHYSVTLAGEPRTEEFRAQPAILSGERRHVHLSRRRVRPGGHGRSAYPDRSRRASRTPHLQLRSLLR